ncbi:unnamed protein product, partial [Heterosigma akashiwo]
VRPRRGPLGRRDGTGGDAGPAAAAAGPERHRPAAPDRGAARDARPGGLAGGGGPAGLRQDPLRPVPAAAAGA